MFCSNCGEGLLESAKFCSACGTKIMVAIKPKKVTSKKSKLSEATHIASQTLKKVSKTTKGVAKEIAIQVGDFNGDGKVDMEDFKIAMEATKNAAISATNEVISISKEALKSDMAKDAAAGAVIGAAVAIPVPLIGPVGGAAVGAGIGVYKNITK